MTLTDRDRKIALMIVPLALVLGYWFMVLGPKRGEAADLGTKLAQAEKKRDKAESQAAELEGSKNTYAKDYETVVRLGKAIPATLDMPSLMVQLDAAADGTGIDFEKIRAGARNTAPPPPAPTQGGSGGDAAAGGKKASTDGGKATEQANEAAKTSGAANSAAGADAASGTAAGESPAGLDSVPLEFSFTGSFFDLADFFHSTKRFVRVANDKIKVQGRLMTIDGLTFQAASFPVIKAEVLATVYLSPKSEGTTAGATSEGPATTPAAGTPAPAPAGNAPVAQSGGGRTMKALALGVIQDLRARRLLPVAVLLVAALVAVPVLMLKPAESATPPVAATVTPPAGADGLPTPEQALQGSTKPLVSLAVLDEPSTLASFDPKDPFKPLQSLQAGLPDSAKDAGQAAGEDAPADGSTGGTDTGGEPKTGQPDPGNTAPTDPDNPPENQKFTYTLDVTLDGPKGVRRFRNLPRLRMLPNDTAPLLVFLGVDAGEKAVFLVDSTVTMLEGEGHCSPARDTCATLSMEPGERQVFTDEDGKRYEIQIDQINQRSLASVAKASRAARAARRKVAKTAVGYNSTRRFTPPVLAELITGVQQ